MNEFTFVPVCVNRGRKFRGNAYSIGSEVQYSGGNWAYTSWSVRLWDPVSKRYVYANPDFVEKREAPETQVAAEAKEYVDTIIAGTIQWCATKAPNEAEAKKFARNCLLKHHPELKSFIDAALPDQRDVVAAVERTLRWAANLRTQPCCIYGKVCAGGKPYSPRKVVQIAMKALAKSGVTELDGFAEAWKFMTDMMELPNL